MNISVRFSRQLSIHRSIHFLPALALVAAYASFGSTQQPLFADESNRVATAQRGCFDTPLITMADSGVTGNARLCTGDGGVHAEIAASNLAADNAYTVWFVYFDQPSDCQTQPCLGPDNLGEDPVGVVGRMDSLVADGTGAGGFTGDFRGLRISSGSEVRLPIFGHGPASTDDYRTRARQLLTPEDPMLGAPGLGVPAAHRHAGPVAAAFFEIP